MRKRHLLLVTPLLIGGISLVAFINPFAGATLKRTEQPWSIRSFDATYEIQPDSSVRVTEELLVDFQGLDLDGIYRSIPLEQEYERQDDSSSDDRRLVSINVESVQDGSEPVLYAASRRGPNLILGIDPDCQCRAQVRYRIVYVVHGAMDPREDHDAFRWAVTGTWPVNITRTSARVVAPAIRDITCSTEHLGRSAPCNNSTFEAAGGHVSNRMVPFGGSLSIEVHTPKGAVDVPPPTLIAQEAVYQETLDLIAAIALPLFGTLACILVAGIAARRWWRHGNRGRPVRCPPRCSEPQDLQPEWFGCFPQTKSMSNPLT